jgi:hypothetical protein
MARQWRESAYSKMKVYPVMFLKTNDSKKLTWHYPVMLKKNKPLIGTTP